MKAELIDWQTVKQDCKYPANDNNKGFVFGLNFLNDETNEVLDVQWFKKEEERKKFIEKNNIIIIN